MRGCLERARADLVAYSRGLRLRPRGDGGGGGSEARILSASINSSGMNALRAARMTWEGSSLERTARRRIASRKRSGQSNCKRGRFGSSAMHGSVAEDE